VKSKEVKEVAGSSPVGVSKIKYMEDFNNIEKDRKNLEHMPDQRLHQVISFIKSGIRIVGYGLLLYNVPIAVGVLILSEAIGIIEELV
tara:strand:- start:277 stop:540 length:264 start_codon:yes stop_codon:yes gene_type:complete